MDSVSLSNIELYFTSPEKLTSDSLSIENEEYNHIVKVMRHNVSDELYVTDGRGKIYHTIITEVSKSSLLCSIKRTLSFENKNSNVYFCLPKLKSPDRFEFALEKSVELGITNFVIYNAQNAVAKGEKINRWQKILLSAMKQSLRSYLPTLSISNSLKDILKQKGEIILFEQNSNNYFSSSRITKGKNYFFVFGPEGGLGKEEIELVQSEQILSIGNYRLRSETAIIKVASLL